MRPGPFLLDPKFYVGTGSCPIIFKWRGMIFKWWRGKSSSIIWTKKRWGQIWLNFDIHVGDTIALIPTQKFLKFLFIQNDWYRSVTWKGVLTWTQKINKCERNIIHLRLCARCNIRLSIQKCKISYQLFLSWQCFPINYLYFWR